MKVVPDYRFGFMRSAMAAPKQRIADTIYNAKQGVKAIQRGAKMGVDLLLLPELFLTTYSCRDLFHQHTLLQGALDGLEVMMRATTGLDMVVTVGVPLWLEGQLYNCAAVLHRGRILGVVPKSYPPNYKNFEELRWFAPAATATAKEIMLFGQKVPFGIDLLFPCKNVPGLVYAVEICEDGWVPVPPGGFYALAGATVIGNPSASNDTLMKAGYRRQLFSMRSATWVAAYLYASCGVHESSTDMLFGGHCFAAENGSILVENKRFEQEGAFMVTDVDVERLITDRMVTNSFGENRRVINSMLRPEYTQFRHIEFSLKRLDAPRQLLRYIDGHPFVPSGDELHERCEEISNIQVAGLAQRMRSLSAASHQIYGTDGITDEPSAAQLASAKAVIGVSGGLDSTLVLLQAVRVWDLLGIPRPNLLGITMPGFGTTKRTKNNAHRLMNELGIRSKEIDIRNDCYQLMVSDGYKPFGIDLVQLQQDVEAANSGKSMDELKTLVLDAFHDKLVNLPEKSTDLGFENYQARVRTLKLMQHGFVLGTGDLSELAKGWCTYNGDQMSMYNINAGVPKTLVKWVVNYLAHHEFEGEVRETLIDIVGTAISPELLPTGKDGESKQKTEDAVGPYELTDFYLYYLLRYGFTPEKILYLATQAKFDVEYSDGEVRRWLCDFIERFFRQQFKRSASPDGLKIGTISFSPRGDWRMPSDACSALWLRWLESEELSARIKATARPAVPAPAPTVTHDKGAAK